jgi:hypothetical protein
MILFRSFQCTQQITIIIDKANCRSKSGNYRAEPHKAKTDDKFKLTSNITLIKCLITN